MNEERRSQRSIGARMRGQEAGQGWGGWAQSSTAAKPAVARVVLVAGESAAARAARREALAAFQVQVVEATTTSEAILAVRDHDLAMILINVTAAELKSLELPALLRSEPRAQGVPIVLVVPASAPAEFLHRAYEAGAVDCLLDAPLDNTVLRHKACTFFEMHAARYALRVAAERSDSQRREVERLNATLQDQKSSLAHQATHDALTGLPNEILFEDRLDGAIKRSRRNSQHVALALLDLAGFRQINERHGFNAGDELLTLTGRRLQQAVRTSDTVARLSGDRFAIVLESLHDAATADYLAHKMLAAVTQSCTLLADPHGTPVPVHPHAVIAMAVFPDHAREREELVLAVGQTLQQAKETGPNVLVYNGGVLVTGDGNKVSGIRKA